MGHVKLESGKATEQFTKYDQLSAFEGYALGIFCQYLLDVDAIV